MPPDSHGRRLPLSRGSGGPDFARLALPVVPIEFEKDGRVLAYFSTVTTFGTAHDAVLQELRVESFCPADERTAAHRCNA